MPSGSAMCYNNLKTKTFFEGDKSLPCRIRRMCWDDITQVTEIDREAFPTLWPPFNYQHELQNRLAHYIVACNEEETVEETRERGFPRLVSRVRQWFNQDYSPGNGPPLSGKQYVIGFAGFWIMAEEAHITNIAVRRTYRRQGIGERLLISTIGLVTELNAQFITLEVRASNNAARNLYYKYGFTQVGLRRGYYSDNGEDGILMSTENIISPPFQALFQQLKQAHSTRWAITLGLA